MTQTSPPPRRVDQETMHLAALADADPNADDDQCGAIGPRGSGCCRGRGHFDTDTWPVDIHVSFDTDRYQDWPVGWKSAQGKIDLVLDPDFGTTLRGNVDYRRGVEDTLRLVRTRLGH